MSERFLTLQDMDRSLQRQLWERRHPGVVFDWRQTRDGIPRFFMWVSGHSDQLLVNVVEIDLDVAEGLPAEVDSPEVRRCLYRSQQALTWERLHVIAERAERVCERLNRSTFAVEAAELDIPDGVHRLFELCWKEDERDNP